MAIFYASTSGSNTAPYDTWAKAATSIQPCLNLFSADGDICIIDDEEWLLTVALQNNNMTNVSAATFYIQSRSGDPSLCSIVSTLTNRQINSFSRVDYADNFIWSGFTFKNSAGFTQAGGGAGGRYFNGLGNVTYNDCVWDEFVVSGAAVASAWLIRHITAGTVIEFNDCEFSGILTATGVAASLIDSMVGTQGSLVLNSVKVNGVVIDQQANNQSCLPLFRAKENLTINGVDVRNVTKDCPDASTGSNWALISCDNAGFANTVDDFYFENNHLSGGSFTGGMLTFFGAPFAVTNGEVNNCSAIESTVNGLGCGITASGDLAQGTIDNYTCKDSTGLHGVGVYMSQGAGVTLTNYTAHGNTALGRIGLEPGYGGAVTFGGWGNSTIDYALIYNNTADQGGGISAHVHGSATNAPIRTINNVTAFGNVALKVNGGFGGNNMYFEGVIDGFTQSATVRNCISWDGNGDEIYGRGAFLTLTVDHSDIDGGDSAVTGEDIYTNNINADPRFTDITRGNFRILKTSPCRDAGIDVGLTRDITGQVVPVNNIPDMGAYEVKLSMLSGVDCPTGNLFSGISRCKSNTSGNLKGEL